MVDKLIIGKTYRLKPDKVNYFLKEFADWFGHAFVNENDSPKIFKVLAENTYGGERSYVLSIQIINKYSGNEYFVKQSRKDILDNFEEIDVITDYFNIEEE